MEKEVGTAIELSEKKASIDQNMGWKRCFYYSIYRKWKKFSGGAFPHWSS